MLGKTESQKVEPTENTFFHERSHTDIEIIYILQLLAMKQDFFSWKSKL